MHALRSYLKLICEYELHSLPNKNVSGAKDHGKNYMKVRAPLVRHLLHNRVLNFYSKPEKCIPYTEVTFNAMVLRSFFISQVFQVVDVNFMVVQCVATLAIFEFSARITNKTCLNIVTSRRIVPHEEGVIFMSRDSTYCIRCTFEILGGWLGRGTSHLPPSLPPPWFSRQN